MSAQLLPTNPPAQANFTQPPPGRKAGGIYFIVKHPCFFAQRTEIASRKSPAPPKAAAIPLPGGKITSAKNVLLIYNKTGAKKSPRGTRGDKVGLLGLCYSRGLELEGLRGGDYELSVFEDNIQAVHIEVRERAYTQ